MGITKEVSSWDLRVVAEHPGPLTVERVADRHVGVDGAGLVVRVEAAEAVIVRPLIVAVASAVYRDGPLVIDSNQILKSICRRLTAREEFRLDPVGVSLQGLLQADALGSGDHS